MQELPRINSIWRHADGGLYRIQENKGVMKTNHGPWISAIRYDHADGCLSNGPYTTNLERFLDRFTPYDDTNSK